MKNFSLYCAKFLITSYTSILAPLLPLLILQMKLSLTQAGALVSLFSLFNSLLQPLFGWAQDRIGYSLFLCFAPLWVGSFMGATGLAPNFGWLIVFLLLAGTGICAFHPASFTAVGGVGPDRRAVVISFLLFAAALGFVLGPSLISLFVSRFGMEKLYLISLPGIAATFLLYKTILPKRNEAPREMGRALYPAKTILTPILPFFAFVLMISITAMNLYSFVPIFFREKGISVGMIGFFLSAFALGCAIGPLLGSLMARRCGRLKTLVLSVGSSIVLLLIFLPAQGAPICEIFVLLLLGISLMFPFSVLIDMAQEKVPQYLGTVSSLLGGFAWGCGGVLVIFFARVAEAVGVEKVLGGLSLLPLINLGLVFAAPSFRSGKAGNKM